MNNWMSNRGFIFEGMPWWAVINLVTLIYGYSQLMSLEILVGCKKLRSFQKTQINVSVLLEKEISRVHRGTPNTESPEPSCRISSETYNHAEDTLFQWGPLKHLLTGEA